jgi:hypothetical protein
MGSAQPYLDELIEARGIWLLLGAWLCTRAGALANRPAADVSF